MILKRKLAIYSFLMFINCFAVVYSVEGQEKRYLKQNWQNLDLIHDNFFGISTEKAYDELLSRKHGEDVIVAVIDGGIDIDHEDLKTVIWTNLKEIPNNGIDDDKNGYVDDIHGWNFLANPAGSFQYENLDIVRNLRKSLKINSDPKKIENLKSELVGKINSVKKNLEEVTNELKTFTEIFEKLPSFHVSEDDFRNFKYQNFEQEQLLITIVKALNKNPNINIFKEKLESELNKLTDQIIYLYNINYDPRKNRRYFENTFHGNNDVKGSAAYHATHVAGILGADRNNKIGIMGVANHVRILPIRTIPTGDYLDSDLAQAIYYAVDNGAKIINMSFIKTTSTDKNLIDSAVEYAMNKDVLIVHGCGNNGNRIENITYPNRKYLNGQVAKGWIEVGATSMENSDKLLAPFSNYGKEYVDVMAPGVEIYSTVPKDKYTTYSGTSMSAPVVSGMAAVLRSYFPKLTAVQIKTIIMNSVCKVQQNVRTREGEVPFSETCSSSGIVNLYKAIELASHY